MCLITKQTLSLLGLAYILKLLDQYTQFDGLHWFQSVRRKYEIDIKSQDVGDQKSRRVTSVTEEEKLQQTKALALKRIKIYQRVSDFSCLYLF